MIIALKCMLFLIAIWCGQALATAGFTIPDYASILAFITMIAAGIVYPSPGHQRRFKTGYSYQKVCDFAITMSAFAIIVCIVNTRLYHRSQTTTYASNSITFSKTPTAKEVIASLAYKDKKSLTKAEKKILKREFKKQLGIYGRSLVAGKKDEANQALLIILVIIGAIGVSLLLAALVCSISCGGAEGLAAVVAILGLIGIIWASSVLIRRINRQSRERRRNWAIASSPT
jgi:hypothetical protein